MSRILVFSNSFGRRYGYSVLATKLAKFLQKAGHQVVYFGMQSIHQPRKDEDGIIHCGLRFDAWGSDVLEDLLRVYEIDYLITLMDVWLDATRYIPRVVEKTNVPWILHLTANSTPLPEALASQVYCSTAVVCPSKFVQKLVTDAGFLGDIEYIPHGCSTGVFKPFSEEEKRGAKKIFGCEDKFVFCSVQRNKGWQKNYPALFYAYKIFLNNVSNAKEKTKLLVLADELEPEGMNLLNLRTRFGLNDNVGFVWAKPTRDFSSLEITFEGDPKGFKHNANYGFEEKEVAKFFNAGDCHVISSRGESFCLPQIESMACGLPQIAVNFSTGKELVEEPQTGLLASVAASETSPLISDVALVDPESLARCMEKMFLDHEFRKQCSQNALRFAQAFAWENVLPKWLKIFGLDVPLNYEKGVLGV